jgi:adenylyltransferase and sulfurtransferase
MQTLDVPLVELVADPLKHIHSDEKEVYFICRLGNDSKLATNAIKSVSETTSARDLVGGLRAWTRDVDPTFPVY